MNRNLTQFGGPALSEVWLRAADDRVKLEWELLAAILCDPQQGLILADLCGVTAATFGETDLQTVYCAAAAIQLSGPTLPHPQLDAREAHRLRIYALAKLALSEAGSWDRESRQWRGPVWSDESLSALFDWEFSPIFVPARARCLEKLAARQRDAMEHVRFAWRILSGTEAVA